MDDFTKGQLTELCLMVSKGCKPCAMQPILNRFVLDAVKLIESLDCRSILIYSTKEWVEVWMYKNIELKEIILNLPRNPVTKSDHYLLGALFGYSNAEICNYLSRI